VLYFECNEDTMRTRLLERGRTGGRSDDNEATIAKRFQLFQEHSVPAVESYAKRGLVTTIRSVGTPEEVYARVRQQFAPTVVLVAAKPFASHAAVMVNMCLETGAARIQASRVLEAEREQNTEDARLLREAEAQKRTPPTDVVVRLLKRAVDAAPTNRVIIEGFPKLVSGGYPGVQDQLDALETVVGTAVQMVMLDNTDAPQQEVSSFRLETEPLVQYFASRGDLLQYDFNDSADHAALLAKATEDLAAQFDPETRAQLQAMRLAALTEEERQRIEQARIDAENDLGAEPEGEEEEEEA